MAQNCVARSSVGLCLFYFAVALIIFLVGFALSLFCVGLSRVTYNGRKFAKLANEPNALFNRLIQIYAFPSSFPNLPANFANLLLCAQFCKKLIFPNIIAFSRHENKFTYFIFSVDRLSTKFHAKK